MRWKRGGRLGATGNHPIFEIWKRPNFGTGWSVTPMRVIVQLWRRCASMLRTLSRPNAPPFCITGYSCPEGTLAKSWGRGGFCWISVAIPILLRNFYPLMRRAISSLLWVRFWKSTELLLILFSVLTNRGSRPRTRRRAVNQLMPVGYSYQEAGQSERALYSGRLYLSGGSGITRLNHYPPRKRLAPILEKIHLDNNYIVQSAKGWMSNESLAQWMRD